MKRLFLILLVLSFLCFAGSAAAQDDFGFDAGDYEVTIQGSGTSDEELDNTTLSAEGSLGYFMLDSLEVGVRQGMAYADIKSGSDNWAGSTRGFADLHFNMNRLQPFIGANYGYLYGDNVNETFIAGPEAGLKVFFNTSTFLYALAEYNFTFEDSDQADDAFDDGRFVYALGMGFRW